MDKRKRRKRCAYANCFNKKGEDPNVIFVPFPKPCKEYKDEMVKKALNQNIVTHHNIVNCQKCSKCRTWIHMCRRADGLRDLIDINKNIYVCSKHFVSVDGPTALHPHPLPATLTESEVAKRKKVRMPPKDRTGHPKAALKRCSTDHTDEGTEGKKQSCMPMPNCDNCPSLNEMKMILAEDTCSILPKSVSTCMRNNQEFETATLNSNIKQICIIPTNRQETETTAIATDSERTQPNVKLTDSCGTQTCLTSIDSRGTQACFATNDHGSQTCVAATFNQETQTNAMQNLMSFAASCITAGWACEVNDTGCDFLSLGTRISISDDCMRNINIHVHVTYNFKCRVIILGREHSAMEEIGKLASKVSCIQDLDMLLKRLKAAKLCRGIWEDKHLDAFKEIRTATRGVLCSQTGVVRSVDCKTVTRGLRCHSCVKYISTLRRYAQPQVRKYGLSKFCNTRYLSNKELQLKAAKCQKKLKSIEDSNRRLRRKAKEEIEGGQLLGDNDNADLRGILDHFVDDEHCDMRKIFLEEQAQVAKRKSSKGFRWHPQMIKLCLDLKHKSSSTYHALRESKCIHLPSERTLFKYGKDFEKTTGFPTTLPEYTTNCLQNFEGPQQFCALIFD